QMQSNLLLLGFYLRKDYDLHILSLHPLKFWQLSFFLIAYPAYLTGSNRIFVKIKKSIQTIVTESQRSHNIRVSNSKELKTILITTERDIANKHLSAAKKQLPFKSESIMVLTYICGSC